MRDAAMPGVVVGFVGPNSPFVCRPGLGRLIMGRLFSGKPGPLRMELETSRHISVPILLLCTDLFLQHIRYYSHNEFVHSLNPLFISRPDSAVSP
jgi:hypothetical protein